MRALLASGTGRYRSEPVRAGRCRALIGIVTDRATAAKQKAAGSCRGHQIPADSPLPGPEVEVVRLLLIPLLLTTLSPAAASASETIGGATGVLVAGFVCTEGVFNTELMAPWDVLQHSLYRDAENHVRCVLITEDGEPFVSAEGLTRKVKRSFERTA